MDENKTNINTEEPVVEGTATQEGTAQAAPTPEAPKPQTPPVKENIVAGIVGAFLFSLAGGALWYILYQIGIIAAISAIVGVVAAIKGYEIFSKGSSLKGIIISVIIAFLVLVVAWYLCLSTDVYNAYKTWYSEGVVDFTLTFPESVKCAYLFLEDTEILVPYIKDLLLGLLFGVVGCIGSVKNALDKEKAKKTQQ